MTRKSWFILTVVAVFMLSSLIWANNTYAVDSLKGKGILGAAVTISHTEMDEDEFDMWAIWFAGGYFFTDHIEVNITPRIMYMESDAYETTTYSVLANLKYNFFKKGWTTIPYVGLQAGVAGYEADDDSDSAFSYGGMAGLKFFLTEDISLNIEGNYLRTTYDDDDHRTSVLFGFTFYFGE